MHTFKTVANFLALVALAASPVAQNCSLIADINQRTVRASGDPAGPVSPRGSEYEQFVRVGTEVYFTARNSQTGLELYRSDGNRAVLVADVNPGPADARIKNFGAFGSQVMFTADDGVHGIELWITDGNAAGTRLVKDIQPGPVSGFAEITEFVSMQGVMYFGANDGVHGFELWRSDGTASGTSMVADLRPGSTAARPIELSVDANGSTLYCRTQFPNEVWKSDGTAAGTVMLRRFLDGFVRNYEPFRHINGVTLFRAFERGTGEELWRTDGTVAGTVLVKDIMTGSDSSYPSLIGSVTIGSKIYFTASSPGAGIELMETDGTAAGTRLTVDLRPGRSGSSPAALTDLGGDLVFVADIDDAVGREAYKLVSGRPVLIQDIAPGSADGLVRSVTVIGGKLLFAALDGSGSGIWTSDGTPAGTSKVRAFDTAGVISPVSANLAVFNGDDGLIGRELWRTDGTAAGTRLISDLDPGLYTESSNPRMLANSLEGYLLVSADDGVHGHELWRVDGTVPSLVKDINPGAAGSNISELVACADGGRRFLVFGAEDGVHGEEPWVTDGTTAGTFLLADLNPGAGSSAPKWFVRHRRSVYFVTAGSKKELWRTDGTSGGTVRVARIDPTANGAIGPLVACGDKLFFVGRTASGEELWCSDGTTAGTRLVKDIMPGSLSSFPAELVCFKDRLAFVATDPIAGRELHVSDGTAAGTYMVRDILPGASVFSPTWLVSSSTQLFFGLRRSQGELWVSDLTAAGTNLIAVLPGLAMYPGQTVVVGDKLYFSAGSSAQAGQELHVSDGTPSGTKMVVDLIPGPTGIRPTNMCAAGGGVFFRGVHPVGSWELYFSDGTAAGTDLVCVSKPSLQATSPSGITVRNGAVYFTAYTDSYGVELHTVLGHPATVESIGEGCGTHAPVLESTDPVLGGLVTLSGRRAPAIGGRLLLVGAPSAALHIPGLVAPGCSIYEALAGPTLMVGLPSGPIWRRTFSLPNSGSLLGLTMRMQGAFEPVPLSLSNAVELHFGR